MDTDLADIIRSEIKTQINSALNEKFGPLLLEIAKMLKSVSSDIQFLKVLSNKSANNDTLLEKSGKGKEFDAESFSSVFREELRKNLVGPPL